MLLIKLWKFKDLSDDLSFKGEGDSEEMKSKSKTFYNKSSIKITTNQIGRGSKYIFI